MRKKQWDMVGHYSTYGNIYGHDDALLMTSIKHNLKKTIGVIKTVKLTHPHDTDKSYYDWKMKNISKRPTSGYYEDQ